METMTAGRKKKILKSEEEKPYEHISFEVKMNHLTVMVSNLDLNRYNFNLLLQFFYFIEEICDHYGIIRVLYIINFEHQIGKNKISDLLKNKKFREFILPLKTAIVNEQVEYEPYANFINHISKAEPYPLRVFDSKLSAKKWLFDGA